MDSEVPSKPVSESCSVLAHWMGVTDANSAGNIHGGTIMNWPMRPRGWPRSSTPASGW
jgi:acyl-CoA hydrolase